MIKNDSELGIAGVVGYMLKVLKNNIDTSMFATPFACIRHGNYNEFIEHIGSHIPPMVVYSNGVIHNNVMSVKNHCDFVGLNAAGPSLKKFHVDCVKEYFEIVDKDLPDEIFKKLAIFEIRIRMHANNRGLIDSDDKLEAIINKLCSACKIPINDKSELHKGRKFLNKVKHNKNNKYDFKLEVKNFENAYLVLENHNIRIF